VNKPGVTDLPSPIAKGLLAFQVGSDFQWESHVPLASENLDKTCKEFSESIVIQFLFSRLRGVYSGG